MHYGCVTMKLMEWKFSSELAKSYGLPARRNPCILFEVLAVDRDLFPADPMAEIFASPVYMMRFHYVYEWF